MIRSVLSLFNLQGKVLLDDREYVGVEWFGALKRAGIDLVIRLRVSDYKNDIEASGKSITQLESKAKSQIGQLVWQSFRLDSIPYRFVIVAYRNRSSKEEFLRLITTLTPAQALEHYKQRYRMESIGAARQFKHLKSNGFDLESLHLQYGYKIRLMMAVVVLAYTLAVVYGLVDFKAKVKRKKHGSPEMTGPPGGVFRWGSDKWKDYVGQLDTFLEKLQYFATNWIITD